MPDGYARTRGTEILNLANAVTFARLCAVPVAVWLTLRLQFTAAFALFALAGISDAVDGALARRRGGSALGAVLDPLADKALLISMFVTLAVLGALPEWLVILVVVRDAVIVGGLLLMWGLALPVRVRPLWISKLNTALQLVLVASVLLRPVAPLLGPAVDAFSWLVAATALVSGGMYVWLAARGALQ